MLATVPLALYLFQEETFVFFFALLPLTAVISAGWAVGLVPLLAMTGVVLLLGVWPALFPIPGVYRTVVLVFGALTGALVVSSQITIGRAGGISARELLGCIRSACAILAPEAPKNPNQVWAEAAATATKPASAG